MDAMLQGFSAVFEPLTFAIILAGVLMGILIGALPGLTATMGVTLLLPLTLNMDLTPDAGMAMLIGIYIGAIYGGSIAAILIGTPGTPAAAATVSDGYAMTRRGEAGRAVTYATLASFFGGMLSALALTFLSPQLSKFALKFSSVEYFALAVFGLSMIVSISGRDLLKGVVSGLFGLVLCTVGADPISGIPRFSFGQPELYEGIGFIPALIGLFAFAQALHEMTRRDAELAGPPALRFAGFPWRSLWPLRYTFLRSGLIGTFIGSLPGAGCDIAAFVGYNEAKRFSKNPEKLGTGEPEGIVAAEAANNGATGGAMIPMLTLGVPGDAVTAVMLGALTVQGLQPGPMLFRDHPETVYPIFASMIVANVVLVTAGFFTARHISRVVLLDKRLLLPVICVLSVVGAYALRYSMFDVYAALFMGLIGYIMKRWNYPASPIVLALILGPMAESNLRRALLLPDAGPAMFLSRPISAALLILAAVSIAAGAWRNFRAKP